MKVPKKLLTFLRNEEHFFIATHISPDGDAFGSSIALATALECLGKKPFVYCRDLVPEFYKFLPGHERFIHYIPDSLFRNGKIPNLILIDCNEPARAELEKVKFSFSAVIDHHETEKDFGDIKWIEPEAPAAGLMVYQLVKALGIKITPEIAANLYSAIAIDTGTFRYSNTNSDVLKVAAELTESGANPSFIAENLYETWSENRFRLLLKVLNTLEIKGNIAITVVTSEMFKETGTSASDAEHFSGFPRMLKPVRISALFREIGEGHYKVSLRSKGEINVAQIAVLFGGGGHKNAAGYKIRSNIKTAKEALLKALRESVNF